MRFQQLIENIIIKINAATGVSDRKAFLKMMDTYCEVFYKLLIKDSRFSGPEAKIFIFKISNLLIGRYHLKNKDVELASRPFGLCVDPSNSCNLRCPGCIHTDPLKEAISWPTALLKEDKFEAFLKEYGPYATHILFYNWGEPLLNKLTPRFISMAREYLLTTSISTNFAAKNIDFEQLVLSGLDYMIVSIDGATPDTYAKFRRGGDFDSVIKNLKEFIKTKKRLNKYTPYLVWQFLVFEHNIHEVDRVKEFAREIGVNELHLSEPYSVEHHDPDIRLAKNAPYEKIVFEYRFESAKKNMDEMLRDIKIDSVEASYFKKWADADSDEDFGKLRDDRDTCQWLYKNMTMDSLGRIMPCCQPPFLTEDLVFASFPENTNAFNSDKYKLVRRYYSCRDTICNCIDLLKSTHLPFCIICPFSKKSLIDTENVNNYMRSISKFDAVLSETSLNILTDW